MTKPIFMAKKPDPEVAAKGKRRRFTAEYMRRILTEADTCKLPGEVGALLRREGLYSSHLTYWRMARADGELAGPTRKRGPKPKPVDENAKRVAELERENAKLRARAERAEFLVEMQKKWLRCSSRSPTRRASRSDRNHSASRRHSGAPSSMSSARRTPRHLLPLERVPRLRVTSTAIGWSSTCPCGAPTCTRRPA